jgi:hypothetical protein
MSSETIRYIKVRPDVKDVASGTNNVVKALPLFVVVYPVIPDSFNISIHEPPRSVE